MFYMQEIGHFTNPEVDYHQCFIDLVQWRGEIFEYLKYKQMCTGRTMNYAM